MPEVEGLGERLEKLEGVVEATIRVLPPLVQDLSRRIDTLRQEVKADISTAFNKAMLVFTAIGVVLALLTLLR
ncbi:hypothetical protein KZX47_05195 [Thermus sp. SYSU G05001]|uniref:Uncharacterized protein n=1 Tax=Thermus brevis TaxID=2862456 RepID=A0ABS6ZWW7_9DEIN|nr:hypothetical protein [Thermus brevis]MBW6394551.1 hypothetical protein [Thermus brevis]